MVSSDFFTKNYPLVIALYKTVGFLRIKKNLLKTITTEAKFVLPVSVQLISVENQLTHCAKSVRIRSFFRQHFTAIKLNME